MNGNIISGTFAFTGINVTTSNAGTCSQTFGITANTGGTISPSSYVYASSHNTTNSDINGNFFQNTTTGDIYLASAYTVPANPTDVCYTVYTKN
ncbi:MAG: hypothetical protein EOP09_12765 [Proteobacteria bacterium]|nr:MAG: hypothetical protein EOP09_12765 [Pseudomonadota bacterium]